MTSTSHYATIQVLLLLAPGAVICQTRVPPGASAQVIESNIQRFHAVVQFATPAFKSVKAGDRTWDHISLEGLEPGGAEGAPEVPRFRRFLAVPMGAEPVLTGVSVTPAQVLKVNLHPYQPFEYTPSPDVDLYENPPLELYAGKPFTINTAIYGANAAYPAAPCSPLRVIGHSRDLAIAQVECAAAQYNPVQQVLTLFRSIDIQIEFRGGAGFFLTSDSLNPFETAAFAPLWNGDALPRYVKTRTREIKCTGEEMLILTHPKYYSAALQLGEWKNYYGVITSVVQVNDGAGPAPDTKEEIDAYIDQRYKSCLVRPSYILLLGDSGDIPTFVMQRLGYRGGVSVATDFPYATFDQAPTEPTPIADFAVGRIPVNTLEEANRVVQKIIQYEKEPSFDPSYYSNVTIASLFQCCRNNTPADDPQPGVENGRAFINNSEYLRSELIGRFNVQRLYTTRVYPEKKPEDNYVGDPTPRYYADGFTPLPPDLAPGSGFPWNATNSDLVAAFNAGRVLYFHLDHGSVSSWIDPALEIAWPISNAGREPVVFNLNCSTGNFEKNSLMERLLKNPTGGAMGGFAFTRMSETGFYRPLIAGTLDALWPNTDPDIGDAGIWDRLGQIRNYSISYMAMKKGGLDPNDADFNETINHARMYHTFGDPSMAVRTEYPVRIPDYVHVDPHPDHINVSYPVDGATITAVQRTATGMMPIGRATVKNGIARLNFVSQPVGGLPIQYSAVRRNSIPIRLQVK
jgi:Peptidase family C25/Propeptide_C25